MVVGQVDDRLAGAAVGGDEPLGQPGADAAAAVGAGAGGAPDGDRHRRVAGDQVDQQAPVTVAVERGASDVLAGVRGAVRVRIGVEGVGGVVRRVRSHMTVGSAPRREALTSPYPVL